MSAGLLESAAFAQLAPEQQPDAIGGRPAGDAFFIDLTRGRDEETQTLSDWYMDAGWLEATFSEKNVSFNDLGMTLSVTRNLTGRTPYISAEFQHYGFYGYGRYEVIMKSAAAPGIVSSFFTHTDDFLGDPHSEIDFEFVGNTPREVHTNYFWDGESDAKDIELWFDASQGFHLYAFEWLPDGISWFVDGVEIRRVDADTAEGGIPRATARVLANIWAANRQALEWVGAPGADSAHAVYRCMSHVPMNQAGRQCGDGYAVTPRPPAER
ncbi:MAG: family 16 glycosylhydrolase [Hyphomonadaceae bacterium]